MKTMAEILSLMAYLDKKTMKYGIQIFVSKNGNYSFHTDEIIEIDLDNFDMLAEFPKAVVKDYALMTREEYAKTVLANSEGKVDDIFFDDEEFYLVILLPKQPDRTEPQIRPIDFENLWDFADAWNSITEEFRYCDSFKWWGGAHIWGDTEGYQDKFFKTVVIQGNCGKYEYHKAITTREEYLSCLYDFVSTVDEEEINPCEFLNPDILYS